MVLPGCLGFSTWYVQGEYSNDIFTFIKVPVITGTFLKWSADSKSEKKMKPVLPPISSRTEGKEEAIKFKMITFKAVCYLVYSRRHLKNTRTVFQKEGKNVKWWVFTDKELTKVTTLFHRKHRNSYRYASVQNNKTAILCKADINPDNPILSFSSGSFLTGCTYLYTYIHTEESFLISQ